MKIKFKSVIIVIQILMLMAFFSCKEEKPPKKKEVIVEKKKKKPEPKPKPVEVDTTDDHHFEEKVVEPIVYIIYSNGEYQVEPKKFTKTCNNCDCGFNISYPKIVGLSNGAVAEKVNKAIKDKFTNTSVKCKDLQRGDIFVQKGSFKVQLSSKSVFSFIAYIETYTAAKKLSGKLVFTQNFDLTTGEEITYETLFHETESVNNQLAKYWRKEGFNYSKQDFKPSYQLYLTPRSFVFINVMQENGIVGDEVVVRYKHLVHNMNTNNVVHHLLEPTEGH